MDLARAARPLRVVLRVALVVVVGAAVLVDLWIIGGRRVLDPDAVQLILQGVRSTVAPPPPGGQPPVLLTAIDVRRFVRKLIEMEFTDISVVSYQEIVPEIRIQPLGRVQIS